MSDDARAPGACAPSDIPRVDRHAERRRSSRQPVPRGSPPDRQPPGRQPARPAGPTAGRGPQPRRLPWSGGGRAGGHPGPRVLRRGQHPRPRCERVPPRARPPRRPPHHPARHRQRRLEARPLQGPRRERPAPGRRADPWTRGDHRHHGRRHGGAVRRRLGPPHRAVRVARDRCPRAGAPREGPPGVARHGDTDVHGRGDRTQPRADRRPGQRVRGGGRRLHGPPRRGVPARGAQGGRRACAPGPDRRGPRALLGVLGLPPRHPPAVLVGNPVVVNPDQGLAAHARAAGWPTMRLQRASIREARRRVRREAPEASSRHDGRTTVRGDQSTEPSG